jgi:hypothetical protein
MTRRLAAAIAGGVLVLGVLAVYAVGTHPVILGSNKVAPLYVGPEVPKDAAHCQSLVRVPAKARRVRVVATGVHNPPGTLRVKIGDQSGPFDKGVKKQVYPGTLAIGLNRPTRRAHRAQICFVNRGKGRIVLAGEKRLVTHDPKAEVQTERMASIVFVRPHKSTWLARRDLIADRFANSQPGGFGGWSLWLALALAAVAIGLGLWWLVFHLEDRAR